MREQKELLTGANKELRRLKKTLKTFEVGPSSDPFTMSPTKALPNHGCKHTA